MFWCSRSAEDRKVDGFPLPLELWNLKKPLLDHQQRVHPVAPRPSLERKHHDLPLELLEQPIESECRKSKEFQLIKLWWFTETPNNSSSILMFFYLFWST